MVHGFRNRRGRRGWGFDVQLHLHSLVLHEQVLQLFSQLWASGFIRSSDTYEVHWQEVEPQAWLLRVLGWRSSFEETMPLKHILLTACLETDNYSILYAWIIGESTYHHERVYILGEYEGKVFLPWYSWSLQRAPLYTWRVILLFPNLERY